MAHFVSWNFQNPISLNGSLNFHEQDLKNLQIVETLMINSNFFVKMLHSSIIFVKYNYWHRKYNYWHSKILFLAQFFMTPRVILLDVLPSYLVSASFLTINPTFWLILGFILIKKIKKLWKQWNFCIRLLVKNCANNYILLCQ